MKCPRCLRSCSPSRFLGICRRETRQRRSRHACHNALRIRPASFRRDRVRGKFASSVLRDSVSTKSVCQGYRGSNFSPDMLPTLAMIATERQDRNYSRWNNAARGCIAVEGCFSTAMHPFTPWFDSNADSVMPTIEPPTMSRGQCSMGMLLKSAIATGCVARALGRGGLEKDNRQKYAMI